jgi:hypothetical protein
MSFIRLPVSPLVTRLGTPASPKIPLLAVLGRPDRKCLTNTLSAIHPVNFAVLNRFLPCIRTSNRVGESEQAGTLSGRWPSRFAAFIRGVAAGWRGARRRAASPPGRPSRNKAAARPRAAGH